MKLVAIIDDGFRTESIYRDYLERMLTRTGADAAAVIMSGPITHTGWMLPEGTAQRAEKLRRAGFGLVVEAPTHGVILKPDTYYYVLAMLLQKMNCVDWLYLPCAQGSAELLERCAQLMLLSSREYQQTLRQLRSDRGLHSDIPEAVERFVPGARWALTDARNRMAVEMKNAMKLSYCPTKAVFCPEKAESAEETMEEIADRRLGSLIAGSLAQMDTNALTDIFGSTQSIAQKIRVCGTGSFTELSQRLGLPGHEARQLLLRCALNYRNITHSMTALYSYVPAIRVLAGEDAWVRTLSARAYTPVVGREEELSDTEVRARQLHEAVYTKC